MGDRPGADRPPALSHTALRAGRKGDGSRAAEIPKPDVSSNKRMHYTFNKHVVVILVTPRYRSRRAAASVSRVSTRIRNSNVERCQRARADCRNKEKVDNLADEEKSCRKEMLLLLPSDVI
ncbi:hypothetical protein EVAR_6623_1 [Eumeta japonica]|uniref:Uncharacterized protein n=1 Tax=Eumeta variegata TaxID=151549 RepID=A0A4C1TKB2_EUMVA|nr:hypothetical protein EVAR_6623_1 [Eumeta japonica]